MQVNWNGFENPEIVEVADRLQSLRERRRICLFEMDEEAFFQRYIPQRKARTLGRLRTNLLRLVSLTMGIIGIIVFVYRMQFDSFSRASIALLIGALMLIFLLPVCLVGWGREIALLRFYYVGKKTVYYDLEQTRSEYRVEELKREIEDIDMQMDGLEIRYIRLKDEEERQAHIRAQHMLEEKERPAEKGNAALQIKEGFSLRENVLDEIQIAELQNSLDAHIREVKEKIGEEERKIQQYKKSIADIDSEYMLSKRRIAEGLTIIAGIVLLQFLPLQKFRILFCVIGIVIACMFSVVFYREYRISIFEYYFEHEPGMFKDYAFRNDRRTNAQKILEAQKEIRWLRKEILLIEERKKEMAVE